MSYPNSDIFDNYDSSAIVSAGPPRNFSTDKLYIDSDTSSRKPRSSLYTCCEKLFRSPGPEDKDKWTSWVVLLCIVISNALNGGLLYGTYGALNLVQQQQFQISVTESSFICSLNSCLRLWLSPVASILAKKWSSRIVQMIGAVLIGVGVGGCYFATQTWHVYLLFSLTSAVGAAFCVNAVIAVINHHFDRYKHVAFSLSPSGDLIGYMVFPYAVQSMFSSLGYSTTMGILGSFQLLNLCAGLFITESKAVSEDSTDNDQDDGYEMKFEIGIDNTAYLDSENNNTEGKQVSKISDDSPTKQQVNSGKNKDQSNKKKELGFLASLKAVVKNWRAWLIVINVSLWNLTYGATFILTNDYVVTYRGVSEANAALGMTILGIGVMAGTIVMAAAGSLKFERVYAFTLLSSVTGGVSFLIAFTSNVSMYYSLTALWGIAQGGISSAHLSVCNDFVGPEQMPILFGLSFFFSGITSISAGPLCGYLMANVHELAGFAVSGASGLAATFILLPVCILKFISNRRSRKLDNQ